VAAEPSTARCPGCGEALSSLDVAGMGMLECRSCDGAWVDSDTFDRICTSTEARAALLSRPAPPLPAPVRRIKYRPCVRCGKMMNRVNFGRLSGTVIDVCKGHGTFLDSGELHAIVAFIQGGGLERVRKHELEAIEDATRQLHAAQTTSLHGHASAATESARWDETSLSRFLAEIFGR
jgi:Zn-finger nucleic acid-binding protein